MDTFAYLPKISVPHRKWSTTCSSTLLVPYTKGPWSLLCASVHCCTLLWEDLARILEAKNLSLIYAKPPDLMVTVLWYPMEVVLKPARTNVFCCAVMAVSIISVWMVPKPMLIVWQPILVTKKTVVVPITQERHCDDVIARNAIQGALVLQKLSSDWTSTAFI